MSDVSILLTTVDSAEKAREIARAALAERLAACVQIAQVQSLYVWKGAVCEEGEFLLHLKHRREDYSALADLVRRFHSYEIPEILRIDAADANAAYAAWLLDATQRTEGG